MDKFTEFIQTRAVPECKPYYEEGQTPESNSGLFCVVPKAVYEEYTRSKRENGSQREPRDLTRTILSGNIAKVRVEQYHATVVFGGLEFKTVIREESEETLPYFISYNQRGYRVLTYRMTYLPAFAEIPDPNSVEITYRYENGEERTAEFYVGDKTKDTYVLMQKDADVCVVTRKDVETKKRNGFLVYLEMDGD
jgi:hypothetical protein